MPSALAAAEAVGGISGEDFLVAYNLGIALLEAGRPEEAIEQLDHAGRLAAVDRAALAIGTDQHAVSVVQYLTGDPALARQAPDAEQLKAARGALVAQLLLQLPQAAIVGRKVRLAIPGGYAQFLDKGRAFARLDPLAKLPHHPAQRTFRDAPVGWVAQPAMPAAVWAAGHIECDGDPV